MSQQQIEEGKSRSAIQKYNKLCSNNFRRLSNWIDNNTKIRLKCLEHNEFFEDLPRTSLYRGYIAGCSKCKFKTKSKAAHKYKTNINKRNAAMLRLKELLGSDYKITGKYKNKDTKIKGLCLKHNEIFWLTPGNCFKFNRILGCPQCSRKGNNNRKEDFLTIISKNYPHIQIKGKYIGSMYSIEAYCKKHKQNFKIYPKYTFEKGEAVGCSKCRRISIGESQILKYVEKLLGEENIIHNPVWKDSEGILKPDIVIPSKKIIIEHNGLYYHSAITRSVRDDQWSNYNRRKRFKALGYRLIQIWGDTWVKQKSAIKRYLKAQLCDELLSVWYARKLKVRPVRRAFANKFLDKYHPQGHTYGEQFCLGLFDSELKKTIAVMTFSETSRPVLNKVDTAELTRYASKGRVNGGASRLLSHYIRQNPHIKQIISFSDNDLFEGKMYEAIGFKYDGEDPPTYFTIWSNTRKHKSYTQRKNLMNLYKHKKLLLFKYNWSETDCLYHNDIRRCWNSGKKRWILNIK